MEILQSVPQMCSDESLPPEIVYNAVTGAITGAMLAAIWALEQLRIDRGTIATADLRAISDATTRAVAPLFILGGGILGGALGGVGTAVNHIARRIF